MTGQNIVGREDWPAGLMTYFTALMVFQVLLSGPQDLERNYVFPIRRSNFKRINAVQSVKIRGN